ncbi:MAG: PEP-CTERM sorting domain-containing protein [Bryobacteraceae bacterium]|nr:PEP-CTERM sorting domain-containing protein [Bryobacteraceae bacterium]
MKHLRSLVLALTIASAPAAFGGAVVYSANGPNPASIQTVVDQFRSDLGTNNGVGGTFGSGRREINWDGVGAAFRNPHPSNFFNFNSPRGVEFTTPGTGFAVSGDVGSPQELFADLVSFDPSLDFQPFSGQRVFGILNSDQMSVRFYVPGTSTVATTNAFGVVFSDADAVPSVLTFFNESNTQIGQASIAAGANHSLSFLGVRFDAGERVARVDIQAGSGAFNSGACIDCVVMDDFIFGEPQASAVPEPSSVVLSLAGLGLLAVARRGRK